MRNNDGDVTLMADMAFQDLGTEIEVLANADDRRK
jgi:hypothetical protein